ncbi:laccase isoform X1 [Fopius arisanus]|uniref:Laccase isoform X1 n=1 Tax=Fopius arisanus TaxID=64838 RepID=A0A9R1TYT4_9HYME|nr:PREDICTED: laccase-like isoform X1 [Fopius arisanus]
MNRSSLHLIKERASWKIYFVPLLDFITMKISLNYFILWGLSLLNTVYSNQTIRYYSRGSSQWRVINITEARRPQPISAMAMSDGAQEPLTYGAYYGGIGRLSTPEECARPCILGARPLNCYYHFTVEIYRTLGGACRICRPSANISLSSNCQCIEADGVDKAGLMVINRMYPGPSIQLCVGDLAIIDLHNKAIGTGITIHWHGLYQNDFQYYDGVPFVTQCPISHGSTFRYQFRAQNLGTHFYHAHTGIHKSDGLQGALIVRPPKELDPNQDHYDEDNIDNIIFINDWFHESALDHWPGTSIRNIGQVPKNLLINGKGQWLDPATGTYTTSPLAVINVNGNRRIRFRMINSLSWTCPLRFSIQNHNLTIIGTDGDDVDPQTVTTITSFSAERYDFVVNTDQQPGTYWIQARLVGPCTSRNISQVALFHYLGRQVMTPQITRPVGNPGLPLGVVFNEENEVCAGTNTDVVCMKDLQTTSAVDRRILAARPDVSIFLPYNFYVYSDEELFQPRSYPHFQVPTGGNGSVAMISGISNTFSGSPFLSQIRDIPRRKICNGSTKPGGCRPGKPCFCSHVVDIPLGAVVDIIMADTASTGISHPFHIHGYGCHMMGQGLLRDVPLTEQNKFQALQLHQRFYNTFHERPVVKDTLPTPAGGYSICRFIANNPGYWLYHCHFMSHLLVGMELTFHVGRPSDLPPVPRGFPRCGDFTPRVS